MCVVILFLFMREHIRECTHYFRNTICVIIKKERKTRIAVCTIRAYWNENNNTNTKICRYMYKILITLRILYKNSFSDFLFNVLRVREKKIRKNLLSVVWLCVVIFFVIVWSVRAFFLQTKYNNNKKRSCRVYSADKKKQKRGTNLSGTR